MTSSRHIRLTPVLIGAFFLTCLIVVTFTISIIWVGSKATNPNAKVFNAYCVAGQCFRNNGMYIGRDPLSSHGDPMQITTPPNPGPPDRIPVKSH